LDEGGIGAAIARATESDMVTILKTWAKRGAVVGAFFSLARDWYDIASDYSDCVDKLSVDCQKQMEIDKINCDKQGNDCLKGR
jgi:hypothetical protein